MAVPIPPSFDLNLHADYAKKACSPDQALYELVANALDAHSSAGISERPTLSVAPNGGIKIEDRGRGIQLSSFAMGNSARSAASATLGQFGIGMKDAIAVFLGQGATVEIKSMVLDYSFRLQEGGAGVPTYHAIPAAPTLPTGTAFHIRGLPAVEAHRMVESVRASFLRMQDPPPKPIVVIKTKLGRVEVYQGAGGRGAGRASVFVGGALKAWPGHPMFHRYNLEPGTAPGAIKDEKPCFDRDHNFTVPYGDFVSAVAEAMATLRPADLDALRPANPTCEFAHPAMRTIFFPEPATAPASSSSATGLAAAPAGTATYPGISGSGGAGGTGAARAPPRREIIVLHDWENAHNALESVKELVASAAASTAAGGSAPPPPPQWRAVVFVGRNNPSRPTSADPRIEVVLTETDAGEAADTALCFRAAELSAALASDTGVFLIVCGTEGRYVELEAQLRRKHKAVLVRFDNAAAAGAASSFKAAAISAVTALLKPL